MKRPDAEKFARDWVADWNARNIEAVLAHYAANAVFHSPKAAAVVGRAKVVGIDELRDYWARALSQIGTLVFELDHVGFDPEIAELFILYRAKIDGRLVRACERLRFGADGRVVDAEGLYGAPI
jgi:ketosteroid isomerase-like protein